MLTSRRCGGVEVTSSPPTMTVPEVGSVKPAIIRSVVVLPQPDGPSNEKNSPLATSRSSESTTVSSPKRLVSPRRVTADWSAVVESCLGWVSVVVIGVRLRR